LLSYSAKTPCKITSALRLNLNLKGLEISNIFTECYLGIVQQRSLALFGWFIIQKWTLPPFSFFLSRFSLLIMNNAPKICKEERWGRERNLKIKNFI
jgi:hypothetical protein